jgi:hypothetical protein
MLRIRVVAEAADTLAAVSPVQLHARRIAVTLLMALAAAISALVLVATAPAS